MHGVEVARTKRASVKAVLQLSVTMMVTIKDRCVADAQINTLLCVNQRVINVNVVSLCHQRSI